MVCLALLVCHLLKKYNFEFFSSFTFFGAGLIEEFDSPAKLLESKSSSFAKLVAEYSTRSSSSYEKPGNS